MTRGIESFPEAVYSVWEISAQPFLEGSVKTQRLLLVASLVLLAGCGSDKVTAVTGFNGALSFTYSSPGAVSGTFNATGAFNPVTMETAAWAAGERDEPNGELLVGSAVPRNSSSHDFVGMSTGRLTTGSSTISISCTSNCAYVTFIFGNNNAGSGYLFACDLETGTVTVTEISSARAKGTFSGTGTCFASGASSGSTMTVTNGSFDVALITNVP